jgi:hypothetical protein
MAAHDAGVDWNGDAGPAVGWIGGHARRSRGFAALSETPLASRFCAWAGSSGRSYVFSTYTAAACPPFCDAILIVAQRDARGLRTLVTAFDTGPFPEPVLERAVNNLAGYAGALEFHVHLLAQSASERRAIIEDIAPAAQSDPEWTCPMPLCAGGSAQPHSPCGYRSA